MPIGAPAAGESSLRYWMVFDIETVPDADMGRRWLDIDATVPDADVRRQMLEKRQEQTGGQSEFLKPPFHQVVAISAALIDDTGVIRRLGPLGAPHDDEEALLRDFFHVIEDVTPRLVGWNTSGFDIPTLLYRAMARHIPAPAFYRFGEPYHGYRKRFDEESHLDLMDVLSGYGASARASLDEIAAMVGVPGKLDVDGQDVAKLFETGEIERIRQYCSHDVLTTTLVFMHYAHHRGWLDDGGRQTLGDSAWRWVVDDESNMWAPFRTVWQALRESGTA